MYCIHTPWDARVVNVLWPFVLKFGTNINICNSFDKFVDQKNPLVFYVIRQISQSAIEFLLVRYHIILWSSLVKTFGMANNKVWYISLIQLRPNLKSIDIAYYLLTQKIKSTLKKNKEIKKYLKITSQLLILPPRPLTDSTPHPPFKFDYHKMCYPLHHIRDY